MRTGIYDKAWNAHKLAPVIKEWGASLLTVNQRKKEFMNNCCLVSRFMEDHESRGTHIWPIGTISINVLKPLTLCPCLVGVAK